MKARLPLLLFLLLAAGYLIWLWGTGGQLPGRVATHFDLHGRPDGWMTRESHMRFMALFGLGLPALLILAFNSPRFVPVRFVNLPHRDYWLAEERRKSSLDWIAQAGLWFASAQLLFIASIHHIVILANRQQPPHLRSAPLLIAVALLLACIVALIIAIVRRFSKPPVA